MTASTLLQMTEIGKTFGSVRVLQGVSLELRAGEVHALAGENGAGKSTLMKILAGVHGEYEGSVRAAPGCGVAVIHQELSLIDSMSVLDNLFLGNEPTRAGLWLDRAAMRARAREVCDRVGLKINLDARVETLSLSLKNQIEIVKALLLDCRILVMDEPTSALSATEAERLFALIGELKKNGCGIIYISHKMEEIYRLADRITVLRDGRSIGTSSAAELSQAELIRRMIGRELTEQFPQRRAQRGAEALRVDAFSRSTPTVALQDISFGVRAGEIVGLAGLQGSGNSELLHAIFGVYGPASHQGQLTVAGQPFTPRSPRHSIRAGIALLTNDRKGTGLVLGGSVSENIALAALPKYSRQGIVRRESLRAAVDRRIRELAIRAKSAEQEVGLLSGGNQQKVVLAKWLETDPQALFLDEPTRGVDVGAKHAIYELIHDCTARGMAVVLISSEMPELLGLADRILVMHRGRITRELSRTEATQELILKAALGAGPDGKEAVA